jgi:Fur family ferric uptake transcriptional regulator
MVPIIEELKSSLRARGIRIGGQRDLILHILNDAGTHLDAETVYDRVRRHYPHANLESVYRTLQQLSDAGLVHERFASREVACEPDEATAPLEHYRFSCVRCGKVVEFQSPLLDRARQQLVEGSGIHILHGCLSFEGYCATCLPRPF